MCLLCRRCVLAVTMWLARSVFTHTGRRDIGCPHAVSPDCRTSKPRGTAQSASERVAAPAAEQQLENTQKHTSRLPLHALAPLSLCSAADPAANRAQGCTQLCGARTQHSNTLRQPLHTTGTNKQKKHTNIYTQHCDVQQRGLPPAGRQHSCRATQTRTRAYACTHYPVHLLEVGGKGSRASTARKACCAATHDNNLLCQWTAPALHNQHTWEAGGGVQQTPYDGHMCTKTL
jgi:hypothetical protein